MIHEENGQIIVDDVNGELIDAAEKYAEIYSDDERQDVKTDVLNAFYHGAHYQKNQQQKQIIVDELRPMSDAPRDGRYITVIFWSGSNEHHSEMYVCWNKEYKAWEEYMCDPKEETFLDGNFDGWIPCTIYRPKDGA